MNAHVNENVLHKPELPKEEHPVPEEVNEAFVHLMRACATSGVIPGQGEEGFAELGLLQSLDADGDLPAPMSVALDTYAPGWRQGNEIDRIAAFRASRGTWPRRSYKDPDERDLYERLSRLRASGRAGKLSDSTRERLDRQLPGWDKPLTYPRREDPRAEQICEMRRAGHTLAAIGKEFGISREWVRIIVAQAGGPTAAEVRRARIERAADAEQARRKALAAELRRDSAQSVHDLSHRFHLPARTVREVAWEEGALPLLELREEPPGPKRFTDADVIEAVRRADAELPGDTLGRVGYDRWRAGREHIPTSQTVSQRLGWEQACAMVGRTPTASVRKSYARTGEKELLEAVADWLDTRPRGVSVYSYEEWAKENRRPCATLVRQRLGRGWTQIRRDAHALARSRAEGAEHEGLQLLRE